MKRDILQVAFSLLLVAMFFVSCGKDPVPPINEYRKLSPATYVEISEMHDAFGRNTTTFCINDNFYWFDRDYALKRYNLSSGTSEVILTKEPMGEIELIAPNCIVSDGFTIKSDCLNFSDFDQWELRAMWIECFMCVVERGQSLNVVSRDKAYFYIPNSFSRLSFNGYGSCVYEFIPSERKMIIHGGHNSLGVDFSESAIFCVANELYIRSGAYVFKYSWDLRTWDEVGNLGECYMKYYTPVFEYNGKLYMYVPGDYSGNIGVAPKLHVFEPPFAQLNSVISLDIPAWQYTLYGASYIGYIREGFVYDGKLFLLPEGTAFNGGFYEIDITTGRGKVLLQAEEPFVRGDNFLFNIGNDVYFEQIYKLSLK